MVTKTHIGMAKSRDLRFVHTFKIGFILLIGSQLKYVPVVTLVKTKAIGNSEKTEKGHFPPATHSHRATGCPTNNMLAFRRHTWNPLYENDLQRMREWNLEALIYSWHSAFLLFNDSALLTMRTSVQARMHHQIPILCS